MNHYCKVITCPVGNLTLVANEMNLVAVLWENDNPNRVQAREFQRSDSHSVLLQTQKQLKEYFSGKRKEFDLPIEFYGTDFQKKVWKALLDIPFGQTISYSNLAKKLSSPNASRAVGAATGKNPISIIVPCHRVIGANGKLTGFAGGLLNKEILLKLENSIRD